MLSEDSASPLCAIKHRFSAVFRQHAGADLVADADSMGLPETGIPLAVGIVVANMSRARSKLRTMLSCTHYVALIWGEYA